MTHPTIRVLVADDEELIRAALVALLEREADIQVVATCGCRCSTASASSLSWPGSSPPVPA